MRAKKWGFTKMRTAKFLWFLSAAPTLAVSLHGILTSYPGIALAMDLVLIIKGTC